MLRVGKPESTLSRPPQISVTKGQILASKPAYKELSKAPENL